MSIADKLRQLRQALPDCSVVVLGDCLSEVVLCVEADRARPQERMDAICAVASRMLTAPPGGAVSALLGLPREAALHEAVIATDTATHVYFRSETDSDILCCICGAEADVEAARAPARAFLADIGGAA